MLLLDALDRFYKADTARSQMSTGVGLSISKEIIEEMDGKITAAIWSNIFTIKVTLKKSDRNDFKA